MRSRNWIFIIVMLLITGCTPAVVEPTPTQTVTFTPQPTLTLTPRPTITPQPTTTITPTPRLDTLDTQGPWLVLPQQDGLISVNSDGSGGVVTFGWIPLLTSPSPRGRQVAVITTANRETRQGMALYMMKFPGGESNFIVPLTNDVTEPTGYDAPGTPTFEAMRAITTQSNLVWSPDGRFLAFIGAEDGESADLYIYSTVDDHVRRLTDSQYHEYAPTWSPDGQYIIVYAADNFSTSAGYDMVGGWAVRVSDGELKPLYGLPKDSIEERVYGWVNERTVVVSTSDGHCGYHDLRTYNFETQLTVRIRDGYFDNAWLAQQANQVLFGLSEDLIVRCDLDFEPGVYLNPLDRVEPYHSFGAYPDDINWVPQAGAFLLTVGDELWEINGTTGEAELLPSPDSGLPVVSPRGNLWGWALTNDSGAPGLWLGRYGQMPVCAVNEAVDEMTWAPVGDSLLYYQWEGDLPGLYWMPSIDQAPVWSQPYAAESPLFWVLP